MFRASVRQTSSRIIFNCCRAREWRLPSCDAREQPARPSPPSNENAAPREDAPAFKAGSADNGIRETPMTLQNNESSGYFQSMTGQFLAFGVSIVVLVVLAAIFVF
jgi:hypothetical protein